MLSKRPTTLDVEQDLPHQTREWRIERVGWSIILLVLIASLLGLTGPGPFSWTTVVNEDKSLSLEYSWLQHYEAQSLLRVDVNEMAVRSDEIQLAINREFIDKNQITRIEPQPDRVVAGDEFCTYVFEGKANERARINIHHEPNEFGQLELVVKVGDRPPAKLNVFVLP